MTRIDQPAAWPEVCPESRPWTRWWWHGSAVDRQTITRLLETYREAGLGGVEITSIYGVQGEEDRNIEYLSGQWLDMIRHAIAEAKRLGMKVDLPPGSGWRVGGPFVDDAVAAARLAVERSADGASYTASVHATDERVKRSGPGGHGRSFNPFSRKALQAAIDTFAPAFSTVDLRAQFHDSWEYGSNACPGLFDQFRARRGYDLREFLAELMGERGEAPQSRVHYDVQLTLADLALEEFIQPWANWCRTLGQLSRNQAHGSPGNLLDLYAAADIPETEVFRSITEDTPLISKFASSAAHVAGRPLVSSETGTWLREHFHVSLADLKMLLDNLFVSGINHNVYHGTAYSPADAEWPGWLFYGSTQLNPQNTIWRDLDTLNRYATRSQSILQDGEPDTDVLVYFPVHDVLHDTNRPLGKGLHIEGDWLRNLAAAETLRLLWNRGYEFDYVSDRQLVEASCCESGLVMAGVTARALIVPPCEFLPEETLERVIELQNRGLPVLFVSPVAEAVPGNANLDDRQGRFRRLLERVEPTADLEAALSALDIRREPLADREGMLFIRRRHEDGRDYFVVNQGKTPIDECLTLSAEFASVCLMDPMTGTAGKATAHPERREVRIQLAPGESVVVRTFDADADIGPWLYRDPCGAPVVLNGPWRVDFIEGGPELPDPFLSDTLEPWTRRGGEAERFAGTAVYQIEINSPDPEHAGCWLLDLGTVCESARVRINGTLAATLIGPSCKAVLNPLKPNGNQLEIEVTNLAANRIRDLERRGVPWRIFEDINFVSRDYGTFDASGWPVRDSGLLGPVSLTPLT